MYIWKTWPCAVLITATLTGYVSGQIPGTTPGPVGTVPVAPVAATPATGGMTLWQFLGCTMENKARCKEYLCRTPIGQLLNNMLTGPVGAFSGGMIPPLCPTVPTDKQLQDLANDPAKAGGAEDVAAKIKADEAQVKAKVAAIKYLATVDCERYPEARDALLASLRKDPSECVRLAAAVALGTGCCCNREVIDKLRICASGSDEDGQPVEKCERVREAAAFALERCVACYREPVKKGETPREGPRTGEGPNGVTQTVDPALYEKNLANKSMDEVVKQAKSALSSSSTATGYVSMSPTKTARPEKSLLGILRGSVNKGQSESVLSTPSDHGTSAIIVFEDGTRLTPIPANGAPVQQTMVTVQQPGSHGVIYAPVQPERSHVQKKLFQFLNGPEKK